MKVLVISAAAPPSIGSHATRIHAFIEAMAEAGVDVTIHTCQWGRSMEASSSLFSEMESWSKVVRTSSGLARNLGSQLRSFKESGFLARLPLAAAVKAKSLLIPDTFVFWALRVAIREMLAPSCQRPDVILSSGAPFSSHIAAWIVAKARRRPLALDYGDPWVYEPGRPRHGLRLWIERLIERQILVASTLVSFTTGETKDLYVEKYGLADVRLAVLPMGFGSRDVSSAEGAPEPSAQIRIVYAGRVNDEYRSLDRIASFLRSEAAGEADVVFEFYGRDSLKVKSELAEFVETGKVTVHENIEHAHYIELINSADALLVLGNNSEIQIPGKVAHFIAARRPIFYVPNMEPDRHDPTLGLLRRVVKRGLFVCRSDKDFGSALSFVRSSEGVELEPEELEGLSWRRIGQRLVQELASSVNGPRRVGE